MARSNISGIDSILYWKIDFSNNPPESSKNETAIDEALRSLKRIDLEKEHKSKVLHIKWRYGLMCALIVGASTAIDKAMPSPLCEATAQTTNQNLKANNGAAGAVNHGGKKAPQAK